MNIYQDGLERCAANHAPLSPVSFVERSAEVFGDLPAVVHGARRYTWGQTRTRAARLAAALRDAGVGAGSTVSKNAPAGKLTVARARQTTLDGWKRPAKKSG